MSCTEVQLSNQVCMARSCPTQPWVPVRAAKDAHVLLSRAACMRFVSLLTQHGLVTTAHVAAVTVDGRVRHTEGFN